MKYNVRIQTRRKDGNTLAYVEGVLEVDTLNISMKEVGELVLMMELQANGNNVKDAFSIYPVRVDINRKE